MQVESKNIFNFEQVKATEPIAPYLGGKRLLAKTIVPIIEKIPHNISYWTNWLSKSLACCKSYL